MRRPLSSQAGAALSIGRQHDVTELTRMVMSGHALPRSMVRGARPWWGVVVLPCPALLLPWRSGRPPPRPSPTTRLHSLLGLHSRKMSPFSTLLYTSHRD